MLDDLAGAFESLVEVFFLLLDLVAEGQVLLLDALNEDVAKLTHVLQLTFDSRKLVCKVSFLFFDDGHFLFFLGYFGNKRL